MNIFLTHDYEIFFGTPTGSARKCIVDPTNALMEITERTGVRMTYFIDIGYLIALEQFKGQFRQLKVDFELVRNQIRRLVEQGNDCQLHIHPHWEDSIFDGKRWHIDVSRYKLRDFDPVLADELVKKYAARLYRLTGQKVHSYRAGGWCLQPFKPLRKVFNEVGIKYDTTVFQGGYKSNEVYYYDFRNAPSKSRYNFGKKIEVEDDEGEFVELPIASAKYYPLFFWQLFGWGRVLPSRHKPIGDGMPISSGGSKWQYLSKPSRLPVSMDGYFAKKLSSQLKRQAAKGEDNFVVIGHPKACTLYSLKKLEQFINKHKDSNEFLTFNDLYEREHSDS